MSETDTREDLSLDRQRIVELEAELASRPLPTAANQQTQNAANAANTPYTGRPIGAELCNCLVTEAPLTRAECDHLRKHFAALEHMLVTSGPRFSNARRDAVVMHNRAVRRLRGIINEVKRRAALAEEDELMEIQ